MVRSILSELSLNHSLLQKWAEPVTWARKGEIVHQILQKGAIKSTLLVRWINAIADNSQISVA